MFFNFDKCADKLSDHLEWLEGLDPEPHLTPKNIRLLQDGGFYIHGRDKLLRPAFVMDGGVIERLHKEDPDLCSADVFCSLFIFFYNYMKKVMLMPGHIEQWIVIMDLNNLSINNLPRKQILAFGKICQDNVMYILYRSYYLHVGWGQRLFYKAVSAFIDPETKLKLILTGEGTHPDIKKLFHPSQLEERFGGTAKTPQRG